MPIYEYRCDNCAHEFETIQKVSEAPLTTCPACSEETLRKKISASGFRLKGGGWYETDFKGGKKKNVAGDSGADGKSSSPSGDGAGKSDGQNARGDKSSGEKSSGDKSSGDKNSGDKSSSSGGKAETSKSGSDAKGSSSRSKASE